MTEKVRLTTESIEQVIREKNFDISKAIAEYIWNGFDASATKVELQYNCSSDGFLKFLTIKDNGHGIDHRLLSDKFGPFFDSEKRKKGDEERHLSLPHGRTGIGRFTFFCFARLATWNTVFEKDGKNYTFQVEIRSDFLDTFEERGVEETDLPLGTTISFDHFLNPNFFQDFLFSQYHFKHLFWVPRIICLSLSNFQILPFLRFLLIDVDMHSLFLAIIFEIGLY